jgi:predicted metal-dependent hydrolase
VEALVVDGVRVAVRRSARARRVRLVAHPGRGVELVLPRRGGEEAARELVATHRTWIVRQAARLDRRELGLERLGTVWRHAVPLPLTLRAASHVRILETQVPGPGVEIRAPDEAAAAAAVERWYREQTRRAVESLVAELPEPHPRRVRVADGSSRWGSCSPRGTVSLSWRLMLAPLAVLDYVVVHELCHLRHPDHGAGFWAAVEALRPGWREQHDWLRRHGAELHAYDPAVAVVPARVAA